MKFILIGSTGFIGQEVLDQCLRNPAITSIIVIARRDLPVSVTCNPKLKVIMTKDFSSFPDNILQELAGAEACIWTLGGLASKFPDLATARKVNVDYALAAVKAFATSLAPQLGNGKKFRFVYCSGMLAERDQSKKLWFMQDTRLIGGEIVNKLVEFSDQRRDSFQTFMVQPGWVLSKESMVPNIVMRLGRWVRVNELAAVMMDIALSGSKIQIMSNDALVNQGRVLLTSGG